MTAITTPSTPPTEVPGTNRAFDQAPDRRHILLIFAGLIMAMLLASLDQMIFSTALPTIVGELDGVDHMLWVTTAYILASTVMMPVYGKLGDLVGRKSLFIVAISLFVTGSVIGGMSHGMTQLIVGRSIQGLGGGGLMILAQAIIADVVPARERGRYMGVMGGVFALSSVAGPLLGGYFTESIGWRWCMWINIPLGIAAVVTAAWFLKLPRYDGSRPRIDVAGMVLLALASTGLVLTTSWGGNTYAWGSGVIVGLIAGTVIAAVAFVAVERRAAEPVMPLSLFRNHNFQVTTAAGLLTGIAMFGALAYMPTYLQMVAGVSATKAGLLMIPMMGALLVTSIACGQIVSRTGRYKFLPIGGSVFVGGGLFLLSTLSYTNPVWLVCLYLVVMGIGLGSQMQILVLVVQNSFPITMVGTATAANTYFRQIGASLGAAVVGSLFTSRLVSLLTDRLPASGTGGEGGLNSLTPSAVQDLPTAARDVIISSYNDALTPVFLWMLPVAVVSLVLLTMLREDPLATTIRREAPDESLEIDGSGIVLPLGEDDAAVATAKS